MTILTDLVHKIYGAQLVGTLVATFLSGMNTVQAVVYFRVYPEDAMRLKALVATIWGLDIIHTAFLWSDLWLYFVINFGQVSGIYAVHKPYIVPGAIVVSTTMILIVQIKSSSGSLTSDITRFYVHRIFRFSHRNYWITTPIVILVLCEMSGTIGAVVILYGYQDTLSFINRGYKWTFSPGSISAAVSDIVIMVVLLVLLRSNRRHSTSLNNVIDQLILYTFETGSLTAFMTIVIVIAWLNERFTEIYLGLYVSLPKVYATTLLGL
ncbi:hypothetical protein JOM56_005739 [Amanita muscaria]